MPIAYILLLALAALSVSTVGAFFSITGLAKLFAGAPIAVMAMAGALEFAKIVAAAFVHRAWDKLPVLLRYYLTTAIAVLVTITSMGIFGYLSHAYQATSEALKRVEVKMISVDSQGQDVQKELARLQTIINMVPQERVSKRLETQKELEPRINELNAKASALKNEQRDMQMQQLALQTEIGPLVYLAQVTGREPDQISKWLILMFVVVFDPLAICLVIATSFAVKLRQEEKVQKQLSEATVHTGGGVKLAPEAPHAVASERAPMMKSPAAEDVA